MKYYEYVGSTIKEPLDDGSTIIVLEKGDLILKKEMQSFSEEAYKIVINGLTYFVQKTQFKKYIPYKEIGLFASLFIILSIIIYKVKH